MIERLSLLGEAGSLLWNLFLLTIRRLQPLLVITMAGLVAWAMLSREPWPYSIDAESEHVTLSLSQDTETNWRIDAAQLCVRSALEPFDLPQVSGSTPCPSRRWRAHDLAGIAEAVLRIPSATDDVGHYTVRIDVNVDGSLSVQFEPDQSATGLLLFADNLGPLPLGKEVLLHFPVPAEGSPPSRLLLPFVGAGTLGKDVSWREPTLLRSGVITLYTRSDEAAGGRELVATTELIAGDRIDLSQGDAAAGQLAKGFVHFDLDATLDDPPVMRVVAFGEADSVRIVRFGEQGFSFSPGPLARLSRHSAISTWAVLLFSLLGLMAVYKEGSEIGEGSFAEGRSELRIRWRRLWRRSI
ncbi:MAG: hypothetical protein R3E82_18655 [Pseudomonadales bacterium]|nr:hypothetical protein [Pseudomonadales bacterium]